MRRRPRRCTQSRSSAASDVYKRQYLDQENNVVASRWTFNDGGTAGVGYGKVASGSVLHMGMQFVGEDEAGNVTGLGFDEGDALDPLHVWWMTRAETALLPNIDGEEAVSYTHLTLPTIYSV